MDFGRTVARLLLSSSLRLFSPGRSPGSLFVSAARDTVAVSELRARVVLKGGVEELSIEVEYDGAREAFGWILPLPTEPAVLAGDLHSIGPLRTCGGPVIKTGLDDCVETNDSYWIYREDRTTVSIEQVTNESEKIVAWIRASGWEMPAGGAELLRRYERSGCFFAGYRVAHDTVVEGGSEPSDSGTTSPISLRFPANDFAISLDGLAFQTVPVDVHVHLHSEHQLVLDDPAGLFEFRLYGPERPPRVSRGSHDESTAPIPLLITHFRGSVHPDRASDLRFVPYEPYAELHHPDMLRRAQATTHLGRERLPGAADSLIALLERSTDVSRDTHSALWALGEIGGARAESLLLVGATHEKANYRRSCIEGLARNRIPDANRLYIECLTREGETDFVSRMESRSETAACYGHILTLGGEGDLPLLRLVADHYLGALAWQSEDDPEYPVGSLLLGLCGGSNAKKLVGARAIAALAVLGDSSAYGVVRTKLVSQAVVMADDSVEARTTEFARQHQIDAFHDAGRSPKPLDSTVHRWVSFRSADALLNARRDFRDRLYRDLIGDPAVPEFGKIVLLGALDSPTPLDLERLREIRQRAQVDDFVVNPLDREGTHRPVPVRLWACARSAVRLAWLDELIELAYLFPESEEVIRVMVLERVRTPDRDDPVEAIVDRVRVVWDRRARDPDYAAEILAWEGGDFPPLERRDISDAIAYRLVAGCEWHLLRSILSEEALHPYHRLYWIHRLRTHVVYDTPGIGDAAGAALDRLAATVDSDPIMRHAIEWTRFDIEQARARRDSFRSKSGH
ncbi:MAG: hypothetical protein EHM19_02755 [Candidatus Latescibacterota bacterium]|nr:MAG: hypothetical protein EHM19_02755 [Candidatus Latescibacterota bacterium]